MVPVQTYTQFCHLLASKDPEDNNDYSKPYETLGKLGQAGDLITFCIVIVTYISFIFSLNNKIVYSKHDLYSLWPLKGSESS